MIFDHIEKLKGDYTDKYVAVDEGRPELRRFKGMTGTVRTVNMNGHALVEFDENNNIGWFDINLDYLKVIDKPLPKPEKTPAKPAPKKAAAKKPAAKAGGKSSTADILAAARGGGKPAASAAAPAKDTAAMSTADKLAALRGGGAAAKKEAPAAAPQDKSAMSTADKLAALRGGGATPAAKKDAPAAAPQDTAPQDTSAMSTADKLAMLRGGGPAAAEEAADVDEPVEDELEIGGDTSDEPAAEESSAPAADRPAPGSLSTDEIIAWCREHDAS